MYRMKGNRDAAGQIAPAAVWALMPAPMAPVMHGETATPRTRRSHARVAWGFVAGIGAGLIAVGVAGLIIAAQETRGATPDGAEGVSALSAVVAPSEVTELAPGVASPKPFDGPPALRSANVVEAGDACETLAARFQFAAADAETFGTALAALSGLDGGNGCGAAGTTVCIPAGSDLARVSTLTRDEGCLGS